ncbi:hypothetical protein [Winogradskyella sp. 3972H.M.0a.05]|uniref:hypothetical protein n=1 Tax=Winogradskyella sp. 3972H.M.0a.05 TaxID=2950277 RepID=UPI00339A6B1C
MNLKHKYRNLILSIILDLIGFIPFIDLIWAPISGYIMTKLYKGESGKIAGVFTFIEEILPMTDFVPSFTIMWFYTYVFKKVDKNTIIEV